VDGLNILLNNRNGPYGYPTWKQIRAGESPVARKLRETNQIGTVIPPHRIAETVGGGQVNFVQPTQPNTFVDYYEAPIESSMNPVYFYFEDNTEDSNTDNNLILTVPYGNRLEYFSNPGLNNRLGLQIDLDTPRPYDAVVEFALGSSLSLKVDYSERIYPSQENAYKPEIRSRTNFTITDIWDDSREKRSLTYGGQTGSMSWVIASASTWPLDPHLNFATTCSVTASDGAGALMNYYSRWATTPTGSGTHIAACPNPPCDPATPGVDQPVISYNEQRAGPTYAARVPAGYTTGGNMVLAGIPEWVAPQQAGKNPYENYTTYSEQIRKAAKDYSIVPEFRISILMGTYLNALDENFLADIDNIFEITGASINNSSQDSFYKTYSNADFLKYFKYVDEDLYDQRPGDLKIIRDSVSLSCEAFIKFLPYKGFYPAERTLELANLLSSSYADDLLTNLASDDTTMVLTEYPPAAFRIFMDPLMSPGILFNTIKSGLAVSNYVLVNKTTYPFRSNAGNLPTASQQVPQPFPEGNIFYGLDPGTGSYSDGTQARILTIGADDSDSNGFALRKIPFEALYRPADFFNKAYLNDADVTVFAKDIAIYDTAPSGTLAWLGASLKPSSGDDKTVRDTQATIATNLNMIQLRILDDTQDLAGGDTYTMAMDNFLCETMNMFIDSPVQFQSGREENFKSTKAGDIYTGQIKLYRTLLSASNPLDNFEMYNRATAFGAPLGATARGAGPAETTTLSFSHVTPPYFAREATVSFAFTSSYDGVYDLDSIFSSLTASYYRDELVTNYNLKSRAAAGGDDMRIQLDSSFNFFEKIHEVPTGTDTQKARWLIQSKFETPILNFANAPLGTLPFDSEVDNSALTSSAANIITRGMWHQYGTVITSSNAGVFLVAEEWTGQDSTGKSLWDLVGMPTGRPQRVGKPKKEFLLEEAVVAVPFKTLNGARQFISFPTDNAALDPTQSQTYQKLEAAMDKYVFPPKFDFTRFDTVDPIMMYIFEFSAKLTQQDIADIWQNLPPDIAERFETQEVVVEERELIDSIISKNEDIQWMVFKVKKRAKKDFEKFRRSLATSADLSAFPDSITSPLTYNWPYDYFSLVELAKIEETATYVSTDLKQDAPISELESLETSRTSTGGTTPTAALPGTPAEPRRAPAPGVPQMEMNIPAKLQFNALPAKLRLAASTGLKKGGGK
jgi:hypothetical protein